MQELKIENNQVVKFKENLSWWDVQELEAAMSNRAVYRSSADKPGDGEVVFDGSATLNAKIKLLEKTIHSITQKDGEKEKDVPFSKEWVQTLSKEDGVKVFEIADSFQAQVNAKKK